jgi:hypothetical protein
MPMRPSVTKGSYRGWEEKAVGGTPSSHRLASSGTRLLAPGGSRSFRPDNVSGQDRRVRRTEVIIDQAVPRVPGGKDEKIV